MIALTLAGHRHDGHHRHAEGDRRSPTATPKTWSSPTRSRAPGSNACVPTPCSGTIRRRPSSSSDLGDTRWLNNVDGKWFRPADNAVGSPTADALGNDVRDADLSPGVFCTNVRLTWLYGPPPSAPQPYLIRAEVRVYWLRDGGGGTVNGKNICDPTTDLSQVSPALERYHFVYVASAIAQNQAR